MKLLRDYRRIAQKAYFCDYCYHDIHPGDIYEGTVYVHEASKKHRMVVIKRHLHPQCPPKDDWDNEEEHISENTLERELRKAA